MHIFFTQDIDLNFSRLTEEESRHAVKVLRLKPGDEILQTDGKGYFYKTRIAEIRSKYCQTEIIEKIKQEKDRSFNIHIAVAPTKNMDRLEWFAEKATEIGIDEISPLRCRFSERKELKNERIERVLIAAMKQSQKAYLPKLNPIRNFSTFVRENIPGQKFIAHCYDDIEKLPLKNVYTNNNQDVTILIGPEGDFSKEEVEEALSAGFQSVSLGNSRLRTETAALVACHTIHILQ